MSTPIRVLLAKPTHDCHDRGVRFLARKLSEAGFEVIFMNFLVPREVVETAIEEDVQAIGISSSSGGHMPVFETLLAELDRQDMKDVVVIGGGVIPKTDATKLQALGVRGVFGPGSTPDAAIEVLRSATSSA